MGGYWVETAQSASLNGKTEPVDDPIGVSF